MQESAIINVLKTAPGGLRAVDIAYELGQEANPALLFTLRDLEKTGVVVVDRGVDVKYRLAINAGDLMAAVRENNMRIIKADMNTTVVEPVQVWRVGDKEFNTKAEADDYIRDNSLEMQISAWVEANIPKSHKTWSTHKKVILAWERSKNAN